MIEPLLVATVVAAIILGVFAGAQSQQRVIPMDQLVQDQQQLAKSR